MSFLREKWVCAAGVDLKVENRNANSRERSDQAGGASPRGGEGGVPPPIRELLHFWTIQLCNLVNIELDTFRLNDSTVQHVTSVNESHNLGKQNVRFNLLKNLKESEQLMCKNSPWQFSALSLNCLSTEIVAATFSCILRLIN